MSRNGFLIIITVTIFSCYSNMATVSHGQDSKPLQPGSQADEPSAAKENEKPLPSVEEFVDELQKMDGYQSFYWDEKRGKIWLDITNWKNEFLFYHSLSTGLGSNPVGLDRGQLGREYVCAFERIGPKVLMKVRNLKFRASSDNPTEQRAVRESFAQSILWGGEVAAATDDRVIVDFTDFMLSDVHGVAQTLKNSDQGDFTLDKNRSAVYLARCKAFPKNSELEATLTFAGKQPGRYVRQVAPVANAITLRQHLSFVELPDDQYRPRRHHVRCPSMSVTFSDYSAPIDGIMEKRWILRHRLEKVDPSAEKSLAVEPIVYYVDPGAPPQIRDALIEGASWWNEAYEAAGYVDAFQVKVLPDDADPMDIRYNVIQWVHRSTRGWSYGSSVVDPRTGEIIKGHVTLGSLRVRQDRMLLNSFATNHAASPSGACACGMTHVAGDTTLAILSKQSDPVEVALARIRQLSAHEVGHTLGFVHNFAASTYDDRASVMDYPAPRIQFDDQGNLDMSEAYGVGIGTWDKFSVQYAYSDFPETADEDEALSALVQESIDNGMVFISDADARPAGAAHPLANLWDNGSDPVAELNNIMAIRRVALSKFGPDTLLDGEPLSKLEEVLVPVYLYHRYQVDATAKLIGGVYYDYALKGDSNAEMRPVPASEQNDAMIALLRTLQVKELVIPESLWKQITPKPYSSLRDTERFDGRTEPIFDSFSAAQVAADMTIGNILQPQRVSRLAALSRPTDGFNTQKMLVQLVDGVWKQSAKTYQELGLTQVLRTTLNEHLFRLVESTQASANAKAHALFAIDRVKQYVATRVRSTDAQERNFAKWMQAEIERFEQRPHQPARQPGSLETPPGSPIGQ